MKKATQTSSSQKTIGNYKILSELKGGAQGFVYVVENMTTHEQYCLKSMDIHESKKSDFEKTMAILKLVSESDVKDLFVKYKEHFYEGKNAILVMEYCAGGDLQNLIEKKENSGEKFSETEITKLLINGMTGLQKLHSLNVIHRDIKTTNFLCGDDGKFKICDLNTSKFLEGTKGATTITGTLEYSAPEVVSSEKYSFPVDVFSFGAVLYQMMVGKTPFANKCGVNLLKLTQGKYDPISPALGYSQPLVEVVYRCLSVDPAMRPTPAQVLALPFVTKAQDIMAQHAAVCATVAAEVKAQTNSFVKEVGILRSTVRKQQGTIDELRGLIKQQQEQLKQQQQKQQQQEQQLEQLKKHQQQQLQQQQNPNRKCIDCNGNLETYNCNNYQAPYGYGACIKCYPPPPEWPPNYVRYIQNLLPEHCGTLHCTNCGRHYCNKHTKS